MPFCSVGLERFCPDVDFTGRCAVRTCKFCHLSLGEQEAGVIIGGEVVHEQCEAGYRRQLADAIVRSSRRLLYLPSIRSADKGCGHGDGAL